MLRAAIYNLNIWSVVVLEVDQSWAENYSQVAGSCVALTALPVVIVAPGVDISISAKYKSMDISTFDIDRPLVKKTFDKYRGVLAVDVGVVDTQLSRVVGAH